MIARCGLMELTFGFKDEAKWRGAWEKLMQLMMFAQTTWSLAYQQKHLFLCSSKFLKARSLSWALMLMGNCKHCNNVYAKINAIKGLHHILNTKGMQNVRAYKGEILVIYLHCYEALYTR